MILLAWWSESGRVTQAGPADSQENRDRGALELDRFCEMATFVVVGRVIHQMPLWTADRNEIFTYVTLQVARDLKGSWTPGRNLIIRIRGGRVGQVTSVVPGNPVLSCGERVVLFLSPPDRDGFPRVLGQRRGVWRIRQRDSGIASVRNAGRVSSLPPVRIRSASTSSTSASPGETCVSPSARSTWPGSMHLGLFLGQLERRIQLMRTRSVRAERAGR